MNLFPIMIRLQARKCVVVGAGEIAASKLEALLDAGAQVTVIAPRACTSVEREARAGKLRWHAREFATNDLDGVFLAIAATNSPAVNEAVFRACGERGALCNVVDDPEHCDFFYPAVVRRGALQIAISTGGRSPALARRLRVELERQFGPEYEDWVEQVGRERREILARDMPADQRRQLLEQIASEDAYGDFVRSRGSAPADPVARAGDQDTRVIDPRHTGKS